MAEFEVPPPLAPGDKIAVIAAAGGAAERFPHVYGLGLTRLRSEFDLEPVEYETVAMDDATLAAHPERRAADLMHAVRDESIRGILAPIGGSDQFRILPYLDPDVIRDHPTRFFGYSDNTAFASYLWTLGIASWQGPMIMTELAMQGEMFPFTKRYAKRAFFDGSIGEIVAPAEFTDADLSWDDPANLEKRRPTEPNAGHIFRGDERAVSGPVYGGNLTTLMSLVLADRGIPPVDDLEGTILAIETSELLPPAWYCEFVLRGLGERGILSAVDGFLIGRAKAQAHENPRQSLERDEYRRDQREAIEKVVTEYNPMAPIVFDVAFGHTHPTIPLPLGQPMSIDPATETISAP